MSGPMSTAVIGALQSALAGEHAAIYGYAALGPHLSGADVARARRYETEHRTRRDHVVAALTAAGAVPTAARADYLVPELGSRLMARSYALDLESAACRSWRYVIVRAAVGATTAPAAIRTDAQAALTAAAIRATSWRREIDPEHPTEAFPGI